MDKNAYIVTTRDGKKYNLASAPELKAYVDRAMKGMTGGLGLGLQLAFPKNDSASQYKDQLLQALDSTKGN